MRGHSALLMALLFTQLLLIGLHVDGTYVVSWYKIFIPLWIAVLCAGVFVVGYLVYHGRPSSDASGDDHKTFLDFLSIFLVYFVLPGVTALLVCERLQGRNIRSWLEILAPLLAGAGTLFLVSLYLAWSEGNPLYLVWAGRSEEWSSVGGSPW